MLHLLSASSKSASWTIAIRFHGQWTVDRAARFSDVAAMCATPATAVCKTPGGFALRASRPEFSRAMTKCSFDFAVLNPTFLAGGERKYV
jgi:hypothetical protein